MHNITPHTTLTSPRWRRLLLPLLGVLLTLGSNARAAEAPTLEFINFTAQSGDSVELHLSFRGEPPAPSALATPRGLGR